MGPSEPTIRSSEEILLAVKDREDAPEILRQVLFFDGRLASLAEEAEEIRKELLAVKDLPAEEQERRIQRLTSRAGRLSEEMSRLESDRNKYVRGVVP